MCYLCTITEGGGGRGRTESITSFDPSSPSVGPLVAGIDSNKSGKLHFNAPVGAQVSRGRFLSLRE